MLSLIHDDRLELILQKKKSVLLDVFYKSACDPMNVLMTSCSLGRRNPTSLVSRKLGLAVMPDSMKQSNIHPIVGVMTQLAITKANSNVEAANSRAEAIRVAAMRSLKTDQEGLAVGGKDQSRQLGSVR
jgi:hypothetical protein